MNRETLIYVGLILFVAGMFMLLAFYPTYSTTALKMAGYVTGLTKADYSYFLLLDVFFMPLMVLFVAIGVALLLLGGLMREKKP